MAMKKDKDLPASIKFNYIKSQMFRVGHADGVIGNATPNGKVFLAFYNERMSLPDSVENEITDEGIVGKMVDSHTSTPGVIRELDMGFVLDVNTARSIASWLSTVVLGVDQARAEAEAEAREATGAKEAEEKNV